MKRLLFIAIVLLSALAPLRDAAGAEYRRGGRDPGPFWYVIASDATGTFKRGGPNVKFCDGADDWEQIQDAVDAAAAGGWVGATVQLSDGRFDFDTVPADQTVYVGDCTVTSPATVSVLNVSAWDTGSQTDVSVGDIVRIYHDGGGTDPATNDDEVCHTVTATSSGPDTITLSGLMMADYGDNQKFVRVPFGVEVPEGVRIIGSGPKSTRIRIGTDVSLSGFRVDWAANFVTLQDFDIRQATNSATYDRLQNGIHVAANAAETNIENVNVWYLNGDGITFNDGHGVRVYGDSWCEANEGYGVIANPANELLLDGMMIFGNKKHQVLLLRSTKVAITNCFGTISGAGSSFIFGRSAQYCSFTGNRITLQTSADQSCIALNSGDYNTIVGNTLRPEIASTTGIDLTNGSTFNAIAGNTINSAAASVVGVDFDASFWNSCTGNAIYLTGSGADAIDTTDAYAGNNEIANNGGTLWEDHGGFVYVSNTSGAEIGQYELVILKAGGATTPSEVLEVPAASAASVLARAVGYPRNGAIANAATGIVVTCGITRAQVDGTDTDVAVGDLLTIHDTTAGALEEAVAGETVLAIAMAARTTDSIGIVLIFALKPEHRYLAP